MKYILFFSLIFSQIQSFASMEDWPESYNCAFMAIFPPLSVSAVTCFTIAMPTDTTNGNFADRNKKALFVEVAPAANNYLITGKGLDNPALVYAMMLAKENEVELVTAEELALRIIENANRP